MKGLPRSLSRARKTTARVMRETYSLKDVVLTTANGATSEGWATHPVGQLPEGYVKIHGITVTNMIVTAVSGGGIADTWDGDWGLGTSPSVDETPPAGAFENLVATTAFGAATSAVSPAQNEFGDIADLDDPFDNTAGAMEINLNIMVDDANITADDTLTLAGEVTISYVVLGDN